MAGSAKDSPTARRPACEYSHPCGDLLRWGGGGEQSPCLLQQGRSHRTLAHCLLEMAQKAGRGHVLLLLDKVWQLLNHQQLCCTRSGSGRWRFARSSVGHCRLPGCQVGVPGPCFFLTVLRNHRPAGEAREPLSRGPASPPCHLWAPLLGRCCFLWAGEAQKKRTVSKPSPPSSARCPPLHSSPASGEVGGVRLGLIRLAVLIAMAGGSTCQELAFCPGICSPDLLTAGPAPSQPWVLSCDSRSAPVFPALAEESG